MKVMIKIKVGQKDLVGLHWTTVVDSGYDQDDWDEMSADEQNQVMDQVAQEWLINHTDIEAEVA